MCVIIYIPKDSTISKEELKDAWSTNPHGAGYSIQDDNRVYYKRGFMEFDDYYNELEDLIGKYNLLLHLRISTSKKINKIQTHPYEKGNVTLTQGYTSKPVICMNGIISGQKEHQDCNDTMSYIIDHQSAFANINQDILNIIEDATGSKWAVMKPDEVILSSKFVERDGKFYSNTNHLFSSWIYKGGQNRKKYTTLDSLIKNKKLLKSIKRNHDLYLDLLDFVDIWCNGYGDWCGDCTKCLKTANTLRDVKITLKENYYYDYGNEYLLDEEELYHYHTKYDDNEFYNELNYNDCCSLDYFYNR